VHKFLEGDTIMTAKHAVLIIGFVLTTHVRGQNTEFLTDDASRADLFSLMVEYSQGAAPPQEKQLYAYPLAFKFPHDALWTHPVLQKIPRANQVFGIDLSHHNVDNCRCVVDWSLLRRQEVRYAYLKASQGLRYVDPEYHSYRKGAKALPSNMAIHTGAYHFLTAAGDPAAQAQNFLAYIGNTVSNADLPPALDLEWDTRVGPDRKWILGPDGKKLDHWSSIAGADILRRAIVWLKAVEKATGRKPIVYTNGEWWKQRIGNESRISELARYDVWIADYSKTGRAVEVPFVPSKAPWKLWQFTANAQFRDGGIGRASSVDASVFNGTYSQFSSAMGVEQ
jgi:lysozyme